MSISYRMELKKREKSLKIKIKEQEKLVYEGRLSDKWFSQYEELNELRHQLEFVKSRLQHLGNFNGTIITTEFNTNQIK